MDEFSRQEQETTTRYTVIVTVLFIGLLYSTSLWISNTPIYEAELREISETKIYLLMKWLVLPLIFIMGVYCVIGLSYALLLSIRDCIADTTNMNQVLPLFQY